MVDVSSTTDEFLRELTALSQKHNIGIAGEPELFIMGDGDVIENDGDAARTYSFDKHGRLVFA